MDKILLVDDSMSARFLIADTLKEAGFKIVEAEGVDKAIELVKKGKPDLILLDLLMPEKDGFDMLEYLKTEKIDIPVVILSSDIQESTRRRCDDYGVASFIYKPIKETGQLLTVLNEALNSRGERK